MGMFAAILCFLRYSINLFLCLVGINGDVGGMLEYHVSTFIQFQAPNADALIKVAGERPFRRAFRAKSQKGSLGWEQ